MHNRGARPARARRAHPAAVETRPPRRRGRRARDPVLAAGHAVADLRLRRAARPGRAASGLLATWPLPRVAQLFRV